MRERCENSAGTCLAGEQRQINALGHHQSTRCCRLLAPAAAVSPTCTSTRTRTSAGPAGRGDGGGGAAAEHSTQFRWLCLCLQQCLQL